MINLLCLCTEGSEISIYSTLMSWKRHVDKVYIQINNTHNPKVIVNEIMRTKMDVIIIYEKFIGFSENRNMLLDYVDKGYAIFIDDSYELCSCDSLELSEKFYSVKITSLNKSVSYSRVIIQRIDDTDGRRIYYKGDYHETLGIQVAPLSSFEIIDINYSEHIDRRKARFSYAKAFKNPYNNICKKISDKDADTASYILHNMHKLSDGKKFMCYLYLTELDPRNALSYLRYASYIIRPNECYYRSYLLSKNEEYLKMIKNVEIPTDSMPYDIKMYNDMKRLIKRLI